MVKVVNIETQYVGMSEHFICHSEDDLDKLVICDEIAELFDGYIGTEWEEFEDYSDRLEMITEQLNFTTENAKLEDIYSLDILPGSKLEDMPPKQMVRMLKLRGILDKI